MIAKARGRRLRWMAGALAAGALAAGAVGVAAHSGAAAAMTGAGVARTAATGDVTGTTAATLAGVPWSKVGPGWELAEYSTGRPPATVTGGVVKAYQVTLYLISPAGARYAVHSWTGPATVPYLIAWSGDKTRALLDFSAGKYEQLTLATGKFTTGTLAGGAQPMGYTLPGGADIYGVTEGLSSDAVARYSQAGKQLKLLTRGADENVAVYAANGATLAVSGAKGLELVSNGGGVIRSLPVPGTDTAIGCDPARWWNATTVLTQCIAKNTGEPRLWLVPVNGKKPTALTPQRGAKGPDLGDVGAWQLSSGLYLQSLGACGTVQIFKQAANGSLSAVVPPHTAGNNNLIVTSVGPRLLLDAQTGCPGSLSLLWYNPATKAEQWLLHSPAADAGVIGVIAFNSTENALPF